VILVFTLCTSEAVLAASSEVPPATTVAVVSETAAPTEAPPATTAATAQVSTTATTAKTVPPIVEEDESVTASVETTAAIGNTGSDTKATGAPPMYVFLLAVFVLGGLSGYAVRSILAKRQTRTATENEQESFGAGTEPEDEFYGKEPQEPHAVIKPHVFKLRPAEIQTPVSEKESPEPQKPEGPKSEGLDFYGRPYYYDEEGMPYYIDPNTNDIVYYHPAKDGK